MLVHIYFQYCCYAKLQFKSFALLFVNFRVYSTIYMDENPNWIQIRCTCLEIKIINTIYSFISSGTKFSFTFASVQSKEESVLKVHLAASLCPRSCYHLLVQTSGKHKVPSLFPVLSVTRHYYFFTQAATDSGLGCKGTLLGVVHIRH